ncbi:hypothetical protein BH09VER1_BH09VER1_30590 [soil metagenome]
MKIIAYNLMLTLLLPWSSFGVTVDELYATACWQIEGSRGETRWVEIYSPLEAEKSGIAHVSVLARKRGNPAWEVQRVIPHLAITTEALRASVLKPMKNERVYPEAFEEGLRKWNEDEVRGTALVCEAPIAQYLKQLSANGPNLK